MTALHKIVKFGDDTARGLSAFNHISNGRTYFTVHNHKYQLHWEHMSSQCGGRIAHIKPVPEEVMERSKLQPMDSKFPVHPGDSNPFAAYSNGIFYVYGQFYPEDIGAFSRLLEEAEREMNQQHPHITTSLVKRVCPEYYNHDGKGLHRVFWLFHASNMEAHAGESVSDWEGEECPNCCDYELDCEGYCDGCGYQVDHGSCAADDEDYWMSGDRDEDTIQRIEGRHNENPLRDSYLVDKLARYGNKYPALKFSQSYGNNNDATMLLYELCLTPHVETPNVVDKSIAETVLAANRVSLTRNPLIMTSNLGSPYGATAYAMADLWYRRDMLRERYGVSIVAPDEYATNPNERNHYIDSLAIVVDDMALFKEVLPHE